MRAKAVWTAGTKGSNKCPAGTMPVPKAQCEAANKDVLPTGRSAGRTMQVGSWRHVPPGCSTGSDYAAHYNTRSSGNNDGGHVPVCTLCAKGKVTLLAGLTWYDSYSPRTYAGAAAFCATKGSTLASLSQYCPSGAVFGGRKPDGHQWAPFSGGEDNEWVQVGTAAGDHPQCKQHTPAHGKPAWGTSK